MNTAQKLARNGGPALVEAMKFVTICRSRDPLGNYLHIGDLQWWCRDGSLDDQQNWRFWYQENGEALALGIIDGNEIVCLLHPNFRTHERYLMVRQWGLQRVKERAQQQGENQYEVWEEASDDDLETVNFLEREGYERREMYFHCYHRPLIEPVPAPVLPTGFVIRPIAGEAEAEMRAALQRDAFLPKGSKTYEEGTLRQLAVMKMPQYNPQLDLMVMAPDGTPAAGCICWVDPVNHVGLFEPVGTRPQFRRQGLATALMLGGLQRLRERGMQAALVIGTHPGKEEKNTEFTSSRFVYEAVGFRLLHRMYTYHKVVATAV
ncbi:MAG: GNAT family N-acetyltransferase [Ktedonobacteraceae bacterium]|nr:GNAT family N-acetyltransferase [Ktedonobacteraceae bacterium]